MRRAWIAIALLGALLWVRSEGRSQTVSEGHPAETATSATHQEDEAEAAGEGHASEHGGGGGHGGAVTPVLLALVIMLTGAKLFGELFERLGQPAVLGELVFGVVLGNLTLFHFYGLDFISTSEGVSVLAEIGVVLLLFEVGLESNIREMLSVGPSSLLVAVLGVITPFLLGWGLSAIMLPQLETLVHLFIGATLCATSVGITARVLADLGHLHSQETRVILGAAVIDDVLGLVILAVVQGAILASGTGSSLEAAGILLIVVKAVVFLVGAIVVGSWVSPRLFRLASHLQIKGLLLALSLAFCFLLAWSASAIDLAPIVGAFAAGLILDTLHFKDLLEKGEHHLEELLHPINAFLVPIFFVLMGTKVDLSTFGQEGVLVFALLLSVVAVIGKMACSLGVLEKGLDRLSVAVGMVPRGEVGLIFANVGAGLMLHGHPVI
ncbi:MAG: cation:proton antiporter, partial [Acidobacteria bacterium]|nr:cation:proton antiporter [Acidobacteriota bacterium]